jgi:drug/metabolite transporter (DMT)-like permease
MPKPSPTLPEVHAGRGTFGSRHQSLLIVLSFLAIYVIWGSTYLAIRYAVETIPPLFVAAGRHLVAGAVLFAWCWRRGLRPARRQWYASAVLGVLFFLIGHGSLHWAEQTVPSGLAALLIATEPIWIALLAALARQSRLTSSIIAGLILGMAGVAALMGGSGPAAGSHVPMLGLFAVVVGAISWAIGVIYSRKAPLHPHPVMSSAMPLLCGAALLIIAGLSVGEAGRLHLSSMTLRSLLAVAYLAIFGSLVAFTAYVWLLQRFSPTLVATHTYVNPVVAVLLGWAFAGEPITPRILVAGVSVVAAIALVRRGTRQPTPTEAQQTPRSASVSVKRTA